ncbi:lysosomal acid glucosylceramidase-like [Artemia franciscana]|uniref:lysosomal acid glucosylceramidase-like n=1 Tax=Artemia franciscana TaxID=6661 RepID=UPI0032D9D3EF
MRLVMAKNILKGIIFFTLVTFISGTASCVHRHFGYSSFVCVCNSTYCDTVEDVTLPIAGTAVLVSSSRERERLVHRTLEFVEMSNSIADVVVSINRSIKYQPIIGFGGAFTDAATLNIATLSDGAQENLLRSYFGPGSAEYNLIRINMGGCDFSTRTYSYDDVPGDVSLSHFELAPEDIDYKIPYIKKALALASRQVSLFASPWSAPAWMKTNNVFYGEGQLLPEYYQPWANYFVKFLDSYKSFGLNFWGLTAQNEPTDGMIPDFPFNCMGWTAESQRDWIADHLGPTLEAHGYSDVKLMIMDDQRLALPKWPEIVLNDTSAAKYVDGIGVHWYTDAIIPPGVLDLTNDQFPDYFILGTEACEGANPLNPDKVTLGSWERGESYFQDIITDLNHWVRGWTDWNVALDMGGGPNWAENFVDSPIIVDKTKDEFYRQPMFYAMAHVSKFVLPGSRRVDVQQSGSGLKVFAGERPDSAIVLLIMNRYNEVKKIQIEDSIQGILEIDIPAKSMHTLVYL